QRNAREVRRYSFFCEVVVHLLTTRSAWCARQGGTWSNVPESSSVVASLAGDRAPPDVAAIEALRPVDPADGLVGAIAGFAYAAPARGDVENAPTVGDESGTVAPRAGVEDLDARDLGGLLEPADLGAFDGCAGITFGSKHHGQCGIVMPA